MDAKNTGVQVESTGVGIKTPGVQDTSNKDKKNEGEDDYMSEITGKDIPEEDVHNPQLTSSTERLIYNMRPSKPRKHLGLEKCAHAQILNYTMEQYLIRKGIKKSRKVVYAEVEK